MIFSVNFTDKIRLDWFCFKWYVALIEATVACQPSGSYMCALVQLLLI